MSQEQSNESQGMMDKGKEYFQGVQDTMGELAEDIRGKAHEYSDVVRDKTHASVEKVKEATGSSEEQAAEAGENDKAHAQTRDFAQKNPGEPAQKVQEHSFESTSRDPIHTEPGYVERVKVIVKDGTFGVGSQDRAI